MVSDDEDGVIYECAQGYPSEKCKECTGEECEESCQYYLYDDGEDELITVNCKKCGKELKTAFDDGADGNILCVDCYLSNK